MDIQIIKNRPALEKYFRQDLPLHLYSLGDLDDFYWPKITCYGIQTGKELKNITTFYRGEDLPVLLAFGEMDPDYLNQLHALMPNQYYTHLSPGLIECFSDHYTITEYGDHFKMALSDPDPIMHVNTGNTFRLTEIDLIEVNELYEKSYPDNAFDPRMLESGLYIGVRHLGRLASIAGIHTYSAKYRVAALGNITTHPEHRGQGFGKAATARLCHLLNSSVDFIGLNVKCDNYQAISLYQSLGFRISSVYGEFSLQKRQK